MLDRDLRLCRAFRNEVDIDAAAFRPRDADRLSRRRRGNRERLGQPGLALARRSDDISSRGKQCDFVMLFSQRRSRWLQPARRRSADRDDTGLLHPRSRGARPCPISRAHHRPRTGMVSSTLSGGLPTYVATAIGRCDQRSELCDLVHEHAGHEHADRRIRSRLPRRPRDRASSPTRTLRSSRSTGSGFGNQGLAAQLPLHDAPGRAGVVRGSELDRPELLVHR